MHLGGLGAAFTPTTIPQGVFTTFDAEKVRAIEITSLMRSHSAGTLRSLPEVDALYSGDYLLSASVPNFEQKAYAKIDARLTLRMDDGLSFQAFVHNLTKKATLGRVTTGTLSAQGTYFDPRIYGVRLGYRF